MSAHRRPPRYPGLGLVLLTLAGLALTVAAVLFYPRTHDDQPRPGAPVATRTLPCQDARCPVGIVTGQASPAVGRH